MARLQFDDTVAQLVTRIPRDLHRRVKLAAFEADVPLNTWTADALATHLAAQTGGPVTPLKEPPGKPTPVPMARRTREGTERQ